ncbi:MULTISPECIES: 1-acylglycerol-3-phosphate O-acyltransferase [unclassified Pseudoalteromonas]|uniref:1-acylglycerol-3-phosphate O-acyltransferase n=1 Tax=unclassified Pseudoalteromonas TaxID=194690 RepID=UPI00301472E6
MIAVIRIILLTLFIVVSATMGLLLCIVRPFHPNNVHIISRWYGSMSRLIGVELVITQHPDTLELAPVMYVANHQNNYDLFTLPAVVPKNTVSMGKKSLKWIPFFGQMYWLSGNILIDRGNRSKAMDTLSRSAKKIIETQLSVWMFPEGTRSYGRGLLPFKTGAFHTAMNAKVPVVPVCMSSTHNKIKLNRWNNGKVYIDIMAPEYLDADLPAREHAARIHAKMADRIAQLDATARDE